MSRPRRTFHWILRGQAAYKYTHPWKGRKEGRKEGRQSEVGTTTLPYHNPFGYSVHT
jgi:hypothetical protein